MAAQGEQTNLDSLPSLVTENIVQYLDLGAIKSLRLSCKALSERCIGPHFKSYFREQRTDLTEESLKSLCALASHPSLGSTVKILTVLAVVYDSSELKEVLSSGERRIVNFDGCIQTVTYEDCTEEELTTVKSDLGWLQARQDEKQSDVSVIESLVSAMKLFEKLDSISLEAAVVQGRGEIEPPPNRKWHETWTRAWQVYDLTMTAVIRSGIAIDTLTVYRETMRCSVQACNITAHIASLDAADRLSFAGSSIKHLALSISPEITEDFDSTTLEGQNGYGIAGLLKLMSNLETLDLHLYRPRKGKRIRCERILEEVAQVVHLPLLKQCSWNGAFCTEETMLQFLKKYPQITHLTLGEINLVSGSWAPILEYLSNEMPALISLRLSNLWRRGNVMNLDPVWSEPSRKLPRSLYYPFGGGWKMVHTMEFDAADLKRGLDFRPRPGGRALGSGPLMRWRKSRYAEYGCP